MRRFIALHPTEETAELLKRHPNAFLLLTQIALRARWDDCRITGLKSGQAFIGDWKNAGLRSIMAYKVAKQTLERIGLATFKGTNKGTIATLLDSKIYSVTSEANNQPARQQATIEQPSSNHQATTNHSEHLEHFDTLNTDLPPNPLKGESSPSANPRKRREQDDESEASPEGIAFADWFRSTLDPGAKPASKWREQWAKAFDDMIRLDKRTPDEIRRVSEWARSDSFWSGNFLSPLKLRKTNRDKAQYFDVFAAGMRKAKPTPPPVIHYREKPTIIDANDPELIRRMEEAEANGEFEEIPF